MRGADANQTIAQSGIFGDRVRFEADLPDPWPQGIESERPDSARKTARRACRHALGPPGGPVHLNVPFDKPLEPASAAEIGLAAPEDTQRFDLGGVVVRTDREFALDASRRERTARRRGENHVAALPHRVSVARRPLLVSGPAAAPGPHGPPSVRVALAPGVPTLADPLSGARFDPGIAGASPVPILGGYSHFLRVPTVVERYSPDLVIRVGRTPTSVAVEAALARWRTATQVVIDDGRHPKDHQRLADHYIHAPAAYMLDRLADGGTVHNNLSPPTSWLMRWTGLEAETWAAIDQNPPSPDHEGDYAAALVGSLPTGATLFASSSMPVRDVDAFARPAPSGLQVLGNRGASGIDGVISSVLGCAAGGAWPMVALVGDIAFYHDMNGLLAARDPDLNGVFVVIDNDGGGIFHMLPIRKFEPIFTPYFATPHGLDFRHAAKLYGLPFTDVTAPAELAEAVGAAVARPGTEVIRVPPDRDANRLRLEEVEERVTRRLKEFLNRGRL